MTVTLAASVAGRVDRVAAAHDTDRFTTLTAVFTLLAGRWAGAADVCVGVAVGPDPQDPSALHNRREDTRTFGQFLSEVRDGLRDLAERRHEHDDSPRTAPFRLMTAMRDGHPAPVSYTHLTLRTIGLL
ncbi:hypothetical protein [Streptomyces sp. AK04-3B]|uniref:hypothetical protein n=1 Tax=Streptomyces sp. AK04-3B TaxID=3028650 RepID=UPI0029A73370|nr:hypothetical protein [Streptomyces sp. AK04-3B]MDX3803419.1 hypothetical protein [Streptomyces sp. AK04-3B]